LLQVWPKAVADSVSGEINDVRTTSRGDILTIGAVLAVYFARTAWSAARRARTRLFDIERGAVMAALESSAIR